VKGEQGPQGPGATTFTTTIEKGAGEATFATTTNGLKVEGFCGVGGNVEVILVTADGSNHFQGSGYVTKEAKLFPVDANEGTSGAGSNSPAAADLDLIARDSTFGKFVHVIAHGSCGSPCTIWGMIIPSG
jgi:hypothetical protein